MDGEMKACPWCCLGGVLHMINTDGAGDWAVECRDCGAAGPIERTQAEAIAAWNTRALPASAIQDGALRADEPQYDLHFERWLCCVHEGADVIAWACAFGRGPAGRAKCVDNAARILSALSASQDAIHAARLEGTEAALAAFVERFREVYPSLLAAALSMVDISAARIVAALEKQKEVGK